MRPVWICEPRVHETQKRQVRETGQGPVHEIVRVRVYEQQGPQGHEQGCERGHEVEGVLHEQDGKRAYAHEEGSAGHWICQGQLWLSEMNGEGQWEAAVAR
jgi:hypothetical protein